MFQQTFVNESQPSKKPYSVFLSFLLQSVGVGVLAVLPLVYTQVLPTVQLKNELVAPPRPPITTVVPVAQHAITITHRAFDARLFFAPTVIPNHVNQVNEASTAPAIGIATSDAAAPGLGGVPGSILDMAPGAPPQFRPAEKKQAPRGPVRVGSIIESNLIHKVVPVYPAMAKAARVQGAVEFTAIISKDGTIENLKLVRGNPLLVNAARDAVLQWRYRPTLLNGEPVEVITDITVNFMLKQ